MPTESHEVFPVAEARAMVKDLLDPKPWIYWMDLILTVTVAYGAASIFLLAPPWAPAWSAAQITAYIVSGFALHRLANFIHEIAHLNSRRSFRSFRIAWNLIAGVPMLMPSYFFEEHMKHHQTKYYGTDKDGEYLSLGRGPLSSIFWFLMQVFMQPIFVMWRFLFITPISFLHPRLRRWALTRHSAFVFDFPHEREVEKNAPRAWWAAMDIMCSMRAYAIFVLVLVGINPWIQIPKLLMLALFPLALHYFRSMTAHNYLSDGKPMSFDDQMFDSIDIKGGWLTELLYPIGLRYHALHHLFPGMPYHNLAAAHKRLIEKLPADSAYHKLVYPSVWSVLRELFRNARKSAKEVPAREAALGP